MAKRKAEGLLPAPEQAYEIAKLREYSAELFGDAVTPPVFDGLMAGIKGPLTVAEAQRILAERQAKKIAKPTLTKIHMPGGAR